MKKKSLIALIISLIFTISILPAYAVPVESNVINEADVINKADGKYVVKGETWKYGLGDAIGFNENTYKSIGTSGSNNWRDGSVSGNGEIAFIESCDPNEDVFIFNNTKIVTDRDSLYTTPDISHILDRQRKGAVLKNDYPWMNAVNEYAQEQFGVSSWGTTWPRPYQPAAQYRIKNNSFTTANTQIYNRYTNYETGEVGVQWKNEDRTVEWNRRSFASRSDNIIVTHMEADEDLNITISIDHISQMQGNPGAEFTSSYFVESDSNGYAMGMVGKYPVINRRGNKNPEETMFARGGWGTATRIIADGANFEETTVGGRPALTITGTKSIMLITKVDRQDNGCNDVDDVKRILYYRLLSEIDDVISKYKEDGKLTYEEMLAPHAKIHGDIFNTVRIDLCSTDEEKADRQLTNTELINKQNSQDTINKAFVERAYYTGRFALICSSGYHTARLGGIWTGTWFPDWSGDFTLDANVNLQIAGANTGNMEAASWGYINLILRMLPDWVTDAKNIYGMTNAIKAPPRVDGTGQAGSYHFLSNYPHLYVNGIADWLIIPIFEYWQCFGNRQVPIGKDIYVENLKEVMDYTDDDVERIKDNGYFDLEKDILYPILYKNMNFWMQYVDERFYEDGNGVLHLDDGTTLSDAIAAGDTNAKYIFTPGYSPENNPSGVNQLAFNTTMDIAAAKNSVYMARKILNAVYPNDEEKRKILSNWEDFESKIPEYLYNSDGALQEWAHESLPDNYSHRHTSHAYPAWPGHEAKNNPELLDGIAAALDMRFAYNRNAPESHAHLHRALIEARLKRVSGMETSIKTLVKSNYHYSSFITSHNSNRSSCYCTDWTCTFPGIINEALAYSFDDRIEILPALLSNAPKGSITGLRARCNTLIDEIVWDKHAKSASVKLTSDKDNNTIRLQCGLPWISARVDGVLQDIKIDEMGNQYIDLTLRKNNTVTIDFELADTTLSSLEVGGEPVSGFNPDVYTYSVVVPYGAEYNVTATSNDPNATVSITQATDVPGKAIVEVSIGSAKAVYTVFLTRKPLDTDFTTGSLGSNWTILNENEENYRLDSEGLTISSQAGDVSDGSIKNLFLQSAGGDWAAKTRLSLSNNLSANNQQVGLIVYEDNSNYLRLVYERVSNNNYFSFYNVANGGSERIGRVQVSVGAGSNFYFMLIKSGTKYTAYYSTDGVNFNSLGSTTANIYNPRLGPFACNGRGSSAPSFNATFSYLNIFDEKDAFGSLSEIKINGEPLRGFSPDVVTYSVALPRGMTTVPVVEATPSSPEMTVSITDAVSIPGVTRVTVYSKGSSKTYNITLGYAPISSNFMDGNIDSDWTILNPDPENYSVHEGKGLRLPTLTNDIYGSGDAWKNVFVRPAAGDWDIVSKVYYPEAPSATYQQQAMLVWQDADNYIKVDTEYNGGIRVQFGYERNGSFTSVGSTQLSYVTLGLPLTVYHRIKKTGNSYEGLYSLDGINYISLGKVDIELINTQIGLFATKNSSNPVIDTYCEYVEVLSPRIESVNPVDVITPAGITPELPQFVSVVTDDGTIRNEGVIWDDINPLLYAREGNFTVEGTVYGTSIKAIANVTVTNTAAATLTGPVSVRNGEAFSLTYGLTGVQNISAQKVTINYDENLFDYVDAYSIDERSVIQEVYADNDRGTVDFVIANLGNENVINDTANILNIQFKAKGAGVGIIEVSAVLGNALGNVIYADNANATVVVDADKTYLQAAINEALRLYLESEEGLENGQYPAGTKDRILKAAITNAQVVLESVVTSEEVAQAIAELNDAINKFRSLVITSTTGDINNIPGYDIGDMGLIAYYYGIKEGDSGWDVMKKADINGDGEIGLYELAFIARRLIR
ncbi:MAG TPA: hypothetical protein GXX36_03485 [Clostridiaceae bacterium]|nr:hypothetical protein [Clostridiaceae bacterium]